MLGHASARTMRRTARMTVFLSIHPPTLHAARSTLHGFRHRIHATLAKRMTPQDSFDAQPQPARRSETLDGFQAILRTGGMKPAASRLTNRQERLERRERHLIGSNENYKSR